MGISLGDVITVGTLGLVDGGDITGENAADAARGAAATQAQAGMAAIDEARLAREQARGDLSPFRDVGRQTLQGTLGWIDDQGVFHQGRKHDALPGEQVNYTRQGGINELLNFQPNQMGYSELAQNPLFSDIVNAGSAESVTGDPFFQALNDYQNQATINQNAALGKGNSGQTRNQLQQNLLLLGNQFRQQNIANALARGQFGAGLQQQDYANQLGLQNQLFGQRYNLGTLGANAAAGQATATQNAGSQVGNYLTQIGNAQAAGQVGAQQAQQGFWNGLLGLGGQLGSAYLMGR